MSAAVWETLATQKRIDEAKRVTARLVGHLQYVLAIHENHAIVLYSDILSEQIPKSYATNAFNVFRQAMHQIEVVRICALWDPAHLDKESIPTVAELIDDPKVIDALANQARAQRADEFGNEQAERAASKLRSAIQEAQKFRKSDQVTSLRNIRDKQVAHNLTQTTAEKQPGEIAPMKHGDEGPVLETSISIVEAFNSWVNGVGLPFRESRAIHRKYAEALWQACTFKIDVR
jgi:AbiU2